MEKIKSLSQSTEQPAAATEGADSPEPELNREAEKAGIEKNDGPVAHLHAKTWLTVFAICLIYFAQLVNVVGGGAVSFQRQNK